MRGPTKILYEALQHLVAFSRLALAVSGEMPMIKVCPHCKGLTLAGSPAAWACALQSASDRADRALTLASRKSGKYPYGSHEGEAEILKQMEEYHAGGFTYPQIARALNEMKIPTRHGKGPWHDTSIRTILNPRKKKGGINESQT